ncbi:MAG: hypothetical protein IJ272_07170 [Clostridia bacterium]|nr:hypothetical protein [Clostridia bacterium]
MATKMQIEDVFAVLLKGGYISQHSYIQRRTEYNVHQRTEQGLSEVVGHISEKQFNTLCEKGIVDWTYESRELKDGSTVSWYDLPDRAKEKQAKVIAEEGQPSVFSYVRFATTEQANS